MKEILRLIIYIVIVFAFVKSSTFGWRFRSKPFVSPSEENTPLTKELKSHAYKFAHEIGDRSIFRYEKLDEAATYITEQFRSLGYDVKFHDYTISNIVSKNIIAEKVGQEKSEEYIIVGAHYDTCFNPGADDNASAVAGLLEIARFMSDKKTGCSIRFVAFVNEEPPFFKTDNMGSRIYTKTLKAKGEEIKGFIILESIGYYTNELHSQHYPPFFGFFYPNRGNFIGVVGDFNSRWLVKEIVAGFKRHSQFPVESVVTFGWVPGVDFSDNWSAWKEGYSAVMITDTAFYRNPHYHKESDTYEKLDYEGLAEVVSGLNSLLLELSKK